MHRTISNVNTYLIAAFRPRPRSFLPVDRSRDRGGGKEKTERERRTDRERERESDIAKYLRGEKNFEYLFSSFFLFFCG